MTSERKRKPKRTAWQRARIYFRRFRITVLLILLGLVCAGAYVNQVGLPGFVKRPLLENLRSRGVDLEFSRLRIRGYRGIVAENVRMLGTNNSTGQPVFTASSADVRLNFEAFAHLKLEVLGVTLRDGSLTWELAATNEPSRPFAITNLTVGLRFLPGDEWSLDNFMADYAGMGLRASARITNATAVRDWPMFHGQARRTPGSTVARLRELQDTLDRIQFTQAPVVRLTLNGDAKNLDTFGGAVTLDSVSATTPWGEFQNAGLRVYLKPADASAAHNAEINLVADRAATRWGSVHKLDLNLMGTQHADDTNLLDCQILLRARGVKSEYGRADSLELHSGWVHPLTNIMPVSGEGRLALGGAVSDWATAGSAMTVFKFKRLEAPLNSDPGLGAWNKALPFAVELSCALTNVVTTNLSFENFGVTALWNAPQLALTNLAVGLAQGGFGADAKLDIASRRLDFSGKANFDLHLLDTVLTAKSREWLANFTWQSPPHLALAGNLTLPAWTNRQPDWGREVKPGIVLSGAVNATNVSYRGIAVDSASTHLDYSNRVWSLTDLALARPEGALQVNLRSEEVSHDYRVQVSGAIDPRFLASQLDEKGRRGVGYFEFTNAPVFEAEATGNWYDHDRLAGRASIAWTNFSYRGQHADSARASVEYTNLMLHVIKPRAIRGTQRADADSVTFDLRKNVAYLTNGFTDTDPMAIATAIGPKVAAAVSNYQFLQPPIARVNGVIPLKGEEDADLHFDLSGGPFRWLRFNLPHVSGHIDWANESVTLTNIVASFYNGEARGNAWFDVRERGGAPFNFSLFVTNADLHALMADLYSPTNRLEGELTGRLFITNANTADFKSWNGSGRARLRDGLIWDTPIFGGMSTIMNTIAPGIGNSRASEANGKFTIANSVIYTRDLDIRASGMRLLYDGTVDFTTRVDARVQAEVLKDAPVFGPVVSTVLWPVSKLFEYKVTGTLGKPEMEPVYFVPKIFMAPLHPMKTLKSMFEDTSSQRTNSPNAVWPEMPGETAPKP